MACADCGEPFEAKRASARFCSSKCRVRHHRKKGPKLPPVVKEAWADVQEGRIVDADESADQPTTVLEAVTQELAEAGKLHTVQGQSALVLARRLDHHALDTGSAVAALVKQLQHTLEAALADAGGEVDELEEMRRRRAEKLAAG